MGQQAVSQKPTQSQQNAKGLLTCPVRGPLSALALAADNLTPSEEARRIDLIHLLIDRDYPPTHIAVETVVLKNVGSQGKNSVRADVVVYDRDVKNIAGLSVDERLKRAILVAEVKRDSKSKKSGVSHQLEPALRMIPSIKAMGIYWDDVAPSLFVKSLSKNAIVITEDNIANLPLYGIDYAEKPIALNDLRPAKDLMGVLHNLANIFRSHKINDEATRYRETVKLILARYCDERAAKLPPYQLSLQVLPGTDPKFMQRVASIYAVSAKRYQKAQTLFENNKGAPALSESAMREAVRLIQGISFSAASSDVMQQVFMSFVPAVFKKSLDQYFTPLPLIDAMVDMVEIDQNDTVADPAMGTADFLSAALTHRQARGDDDIVSRLYGADADKMAFDLAIVNMILHRDGQSNFLNEDSLENFDRWEELISVALCNPPFGEKSLEKRQGVLEHYDLGFVWKIDNGIWERTDELLNSQQLGILFIEKCFKMLHDGGRVAIILPEGYLCTPSYGYVRQWITDNLKVLALVELPRRIFNRSDADLRANIMVAEKISPDDLSLAKKRNYPIYSELIRKVGFKMGKGFSPEFQRDQNTGIIIRDDANEPLIDSDFSGLRQRFKSFLHQIALPSAVNSKVHNWDAWEGAHISDVLDHPNLDLKPRRLCKKAIQRVQGIVAAPHFFLRNVADVVTHKLDLVDEENAARSWRLVEGLSIRAVEGTVVPHSPTPAWQIVEDKQRKVYLLEDGDIVVGLVRPERRNVGYLMDTGDDIVATPDGVAVVRVKNNNLGVTQEYLFSLLRSEDARIQLWTESGGTSYGKLRDEHILNLRFAEPNKSEIASVTEAVSAWIKAARLSATTWERIGAEQDRVPIVNSPMFGLEPD